MIYRWLAILVALVMVFSLTASGVQAQSSDDISMPAAADPLYWEVQRVDDPPLYAYMTDRNLRLDANNIPHIAYGGDHLYYATLVGGIWQVEIVDASEGVGMFAS
jgi:hypothetical protein